MSIDFSKVTGWSTKRGNLVQVADSAGRVIWAVSGGDTAILEVEKITSNTYAGETTYENEQFILLDIYPKTNGTVKVTYGGLTKTITDTSGVAEPNAQQVFFGTFNGVSDSVETPASGELTIEGDYYAFGSGFYSTSNKSSASGCKTISVKSFGNISEIADSAFVHDMNNSSLESICDIPDTVTSIGAYSFFNCLLAEITIPQNITYIGFYAFGNTIPNHASTLRTVKILTTIPPEIGAHADTGSQYCFAKVDSDYFAIEKIIVPKGCAEVYRAAAGWSTYADYIVEAS